MGGGGVDDTRNVCVEGAFWWPAAVAGRCAASIYATDAGHRFGARRRPG